MISVDLNCDMGEGMPNDATLMPLITSANIACGHHAGNEDMMKRTVELALRYNVAIGAHPGFNDPQHFGRTELKLTDNEYYELVFSQLTVLKKITDERGAVIHHVKPHGALYNMAAKNKTLASLLAKAIKNFDQNLVVYGLSGSASITQAKAAGLKTASEVFADRTYQNDGSLTPRSSSNALITDEDQSIKQVLTMIRNKVVISVDAVTVPIQADTICLHGDGPHAVAFATKINSVLKQQDIAIHAVAKVG